MSAVPASTTPSVSPELLNEHQELVQSRIKHDLATLQKSPSVDSDEAAPVSVETVNSAVENASTLTSSSNNKSSSMVQFKHFDPAKLGIKGVRKRQLLDGELPVIFSYPNGDSPVQSENSHSSFMLKFKTSPPNVISQSTYPSDSPPPLTPKDPIDHSTTDQVLSVGVTAPRSISVPRYSLGKDAKHLSDSDSLSSIPPSKRRNYKPKGSQFRIIQVTGEKMRSDESLRYAKLADSENSGNRLMKNQQKSQKEVIFQHYSPNDSGDKMIKSYEPSSTSNLTGDGDITSTNMDEDYQSLVTRGLDTASSSSNYYSKEMEFKNRLVDWIIKAQVSLSAITTEEFKLLVEHIGYQGSVPSMEELRMLLAQRCPP